MSRVLNFLWLNLEFASPFETGFRQPMPSDYIEKIRQSALTNNDTDVFLWIDSKRLTPQQIDFLKKSLESPAQSNLIIKDLRSIPEYREEALFNQQQTTPEWRNRDKNSVIWRQVDAAKVLISLQGDYDQTFYADLDYSKLATHSASVQDKLCNHGLLFRGFIKDDKACFENQLWGFTRERRDFFETLYQNTLTAAHYGMNGYHDLISLIKERLEKKEGMDTKNLCYTAGHDGSSAYHPDHKWSHGHALQTTHNPFSLTGAYTKKTASLFEDDGEQLSAQWGKALGSSFNIDKSPLSTETFAKKIDFSFLKSAPDTKG